VTSTSLSFASANRPTRSSRLEPKVGIAHIEVRAADGTFTIGRETFPDFDRYARLGVHIQADQVRIATPPPEYVEAAITALAEACRELAVPHADIAFVDTVVPPPRFGLRYGFKGAYTTAAPTVIWIFANWTSRDELRLVVRHEAAHLAFARTHTIEDSAGHAGPSEDFALAFEVGVSDG
jgi:hypothetical protein